MRCVGNLNNKIIVPTDGSSGTDVITKIDEFFNLGVKDMGNLPGSGFTSTRSGRSDSVAFSTPSTLTGA